MKLALMTLGVLAVIAGTASASLFSSPDRNAAAATVTPPTTTLTQVVASIPEPVRQSPRALFEVKGEPVPQLHLAKHMPYVPPAANEEPDIIQQVATAEPPKMSEDMARNAIMTDGYKGVRGITRGADGTWAARALRGNTEIGVTVTADGRVSAD